MQVPPTPLQRLNDPLIAGYNVPLFIKREDLIHPEISGNKWWKLKYNLLEAQQKQQQTLLTFGGAYSNHIAATAAAGKIYGFKTIGIIRGENAHPLNATLQKASANGMHLYFIDRETYRKKENPDFIEELHSRFGAFYLIPEGGSNALGVKGSSEILQNRELDYNYLCCPCGTGATLAGLILSASPDKKVIGFSSLKGGQFLEQEIQHYLNMFGHRNTKNWEVILDFHFGGYAKTTPELLDFTTSFKERTGVPLDYIYTAKMMYGIYKLIREGRFKEGKKILAIHTGGLQGNAGFFEGIKER